MIMFDRVVKVIYSYLISIALIITFIDVMATLGIHYYITTERVTYMKSIQFLSGNIYEDLTIVLVTLSLVQIPRCITLRRVEIPMILTLLSLMILFIMYFLNMQTLAIQVLVLTLLFSNVLLTLKYFKQYNTFLKTFLTLISIISILYLPCTFLTGRELNLVLNSTLMIIVKVFEYLYHSLDFTCIALSAILLLSPFLKSLITMYVNLLFKFKIEDKFYVSILNIFSKLRNFINVELESFSFSKRRLLIIALVLSIVIPSIPYIPLLNPRQYSISVDVVYYEKWLYEIDSYGINKAFEVSQGSRPIYLLLLYTIHEVFNIPIPIIAKYHIIALFPLYTLAIYVFTRELIGDESVASFTALLTPITPICIAFLYGGFQACFFTLSLMIITLSLLVRLSSLRLVLAIAISSICLWSHPWTWTQYLASIILYYVIYILHSKRVDKNFLMLTIFITVNVIHGIVRDILGFGLASSISTVSAQAQEILALNVSGLFATFSYYLWCSLNNWIFLLLALMGSFMFRKITYYHTLSLSSLFAYILSLSSAGLISRILINIPAQIPFTLTLLKVSRLSRDIMITIIVLMVVFALYQILNAIPTF